MSHAHWALAFIASFVVCQLADWIFAGVLFHDKYLETPEIWRAGVQGKGELRGIAIASIFTAISVLTLQGLMMHIEIGSYTGACKLATAIWVVAALPVIVGNAVFIRIHALNATSHAAGWLVKLIATALITEYFLMLG